MKKFLALSFLSLLTVTSAMAKMPYLAAFKKQYPSATTAKCTTCHEAGGYTVRNAYGHDFETHDHNFVAIEGLDSDGDGFTNLQEITAGTNAADLNSHP